VRGETDELFEQAIQFIESLDISQLHVFSYSERAGTKMLEIEHKVTTTERKRRSDVLHILSDKKTKLFYEGQMGKSIQVLWESRHNGDFMVGFSNNYVKAERTFDKSLVNNIQTVVLGNWNEGKTALVCEDV